MRTGGKPKPFHGVNLDVDASGSKKDFSGSRPPTSHGSTRSPPCSRWQMESAWKGRDAGSCKPDGGYRRKSAGSRCLIKGVEEVTSEAGFLGFVEAVAVNEIALCEIEEFDLHETASLICPFAVSQSMKAALPSLMSCPRSSRRSLCH